MAKTLKYINYTIFAYRFHKKQKHIDIFNNYAISQYSKYIIFIAKTNV